MEIGEAKRYANIIPMDELETKQKRLNPFPIYNQLRQTTPVRFDEKRGCWDVFTYEDVHRILKDPAVFSSRRNLSVNKQETILTMDPPRHNQMRALVNKAFTPKMVNDLATHIERITKKLLAEKKDEGHMDIVNDLAVPLPVIVIAQLLGVPVEDRKLFKEWSDILVKGLDKNTDEAFYQVISEKEKAVGELSRYFAQILNKTQKGRDENLISILKEAEIEGQKLTQEEIISFSILLLAAGNETTTNLITNAVRRITEDQNLQQKLREEPDLIPSFIEEVLRYYPPIQAIGRVVVKDVEVGGHTLRAGDQVVSWVAAANRDEKRFIEPNTFQVDRKPNPHLSFGFGIHFCLGAPLARLEGQIAIKKILEKLKEIKFIEGNELINIQSPFVFGVKEFPVSFIHR